MTLDLMSCPKLAFTIFSQGNIFEASRDVLTMHFCSSIQLGHYLRMIPSTRKARFKVGKKMRSLKTT